MEPNASEAIKEHFRLADRFLQTARANQGLGDLRSAVDRAYYAMFHAASAALERKGITVKRHSTLHQRFNEEYLKTGVMDPELGKYLPRAYSLRQDSDYKLFSEIDESRADEIVGRAEEFVAKLKEILGFK